MNLEPAVVPHFLSTACAAIFLLVLPVRLWTLRTFRIKRSPSRGARLKAALGALLSMVLLAYWAEASSLELQHELNYRFSLIISAVAVLGLTVLLFQEEERSQRHSDVATLYLSISVLCDAVYLTMPHDIPRESRISRAVLLRCCMQSVLLFSTYHTQRTVLRPGSNGQSPEPPRSLLSKALFLWINPILLRGYGNILTHRDMPALSQDMKPESTRKAIRQTWSQRAKPETPASLPLALLKSLRGPFLAASAPRLCLIIFRYSQPILIEKSIKFFARPPAETDAAHGYWLVVSAVAIYLGLALSTAAYQHSIARLKLMTRSSLMGLIHDKTMESPSVTYDNGEAITLMSTDADSLDGIAEMLHETWAQVVEVLIGIWLLAGQVGRVWPLPLFLIYLCSHMSRFVAKNLQPRQKVWNNSTQTRIAATSTMLQAMKLVKMLGFQDHMSRRVQKLRESELWAASRLRWVMVYYNASANALGIFTPAITLVISALISATRLDATTAFTTMAILSMVTHPANMIMTIVPRVKKLAPDSADGQAVSPNTAIHIKQLRIGNTPSILENVNMNVSAGQFVIISGATGSGKSTLLRAILGEVVPTRGKVRVSAHQRAYCAQRPWLPSGSIKEVIYGATDIYAESDEYYQKWYDEVIEACCLTHDIGSFAKGDQTQIGGRGLNLSGGQRQRVALARALFARCDMLLLDDTFSGLDGETEGAIFSNLFGPSGLLRRLNTTVILVSNSSQYFSAAEHIVILGNRGIVDQGRWENLKVKAESIAKFSSSRTTGDSAILGNNFDKLSAQLRARGEIGADLTRQTGDIALYGYYMGFINFTALLYLVASTAIYSVFITVPQYWLRLWTESGDKNAVFYVCGFIFISTMSWFFTSVQMWSVLIQLAPQSGMRLHQRLLHIITSAPLSFFSKTDNGSVLNRFTQDTQIVDKQLPGALQATTTQIFKLLMQIIVLCVAEKWLALSLPACMLLVYAVQKVYLRTSRQLRYLELDSRANIFSSFLESIEGLETIRAFGWPRAIMDSNTVTVDNSQRPEFLLLCVQRWLNLVLDLLGAGIATSVIAIAVAFRGHVSGAQVGIALNIMLVTNTTLLKLVENFTTLEISLGAISRLRTLEHTTPSESDTVWTVDPPKTWPSKGHIKFDNAVASYNSESTAIKNLSLDIRPGQKLIVCGRTGSGKSTLLLTLLRLLELRSGKIELDGIDIGQVNLGVLRQRCFIAMSQDPLILPEETLRFNLDPDGSVLDEILIAALAKVRLWSHFIESDRGAERGTEHSILDQKVSLFQELSVGQCQLFAVCRALVKAASLEALGVKPVVVLDEVTSSLDVATESIIYQVVDKEFTEKGHTVIIIAHRVGALDKYMRAGRDAIAFMADGSLQELRNS
ncbi:putative ABC transporter [Nemania sp. NC0429]|nr:putative ABC transporter [Nemania sp. NC0429]